MKKLCHECVKELDDLLPFKCKYCGEFFCKDHYLPENHKCPDFKPRSWIKPISTIPVESELPTEPETPSKPEPKPEDISKPIKETESIKVKPQTTELKTEITPERIEAPKKSTKPTKLKICTIIFIVIIILLVAVSVGGYCVFSQSYSELEQEKQVLENELTGLYSTLNDTETKMENYNNSLKENVSELQELMSGDAYHLHEPTYNEVVDFIEKDNSYDYATLISNSKNQGIRCTFVYIIITDGVYYLTGFNTTDEGMVYYEADTHYQVIPEVGKSYTSCVVDNPYSPTDDIIEEILIIW